MKIELRSPDKITPYDKNPRHNDGAVEAVAKSIAAFGFKQPIVTDEQGVIVVGHTRWKAAKQLGLKQVPVHVAKDLSPEQAKAYRIADNQTATIATFDVDLLSVELADLQALDFDMSLLGFDDKELARLMNAGGTLGECDPDDIPAPPDEAITQPGDLWLLGKHRLKCSDAGNAADVDHLLDGQPVHLISTDPPYGVKVEPRSNNAIAVGLSSFGPTNTQPQNHHQSFDVARQGKKSKTTKQLRAKDRPLANDFVSDAEFDALLDAWFGTISRVLLPGRCFYIWGGYANLGNYPPVLKRHGLYFSQGIVWDKMHPVLSRKDFMGAFELAFYGWREGAGHEFFGPSNATDLWQVKKVNPQSMQHLTQKPVELAARAIAYSSRPGENVLDLFGGSGSTLIACEQQGRRAFLMELDAPYTDLIVTRWQNFTGQQAINEATGKPYPTPPSTKREETR